MTFAQRHWLLYFVWMKGHIPYTERYEQLLFKLNHTVSTAEAARDPYGDWCVNDMYDELNLDHTEAGCRGYSEVSPRMAGLTWDTYSPNGKISIWKFNFQKEFDY